MIIYVFYTFRIRNIAFSLVKALKIGLALEKIIKYFAARWCDMIKPRLNALSESPETSLKF